MLDPVIVLNKKRFSTNFNITCGFSDFHNLVGCVTKLTISRQKPKKIIYRSYKNFCQDAFKYDVSCIPFYTCDIFEDVDDQYWMYSTLLSQVLDDHAPTKCKFIKKNQVPYMNRNLLKAMYHRNFLKNRYMKRKTNENWAKYKKQRNKVTYLHRHSIKTYFDSRCKNESDGKTFWKIIKPFMTDKCKVSENIMLAEDDSVVSDQHEVVNIFNNYFSSIANSIGQPDDINMDESIESVFQRHKNHPSILAINENFDNTKSFNLSPASVSSVRAYMSSLDGHKSTGYDAIPAKIIKLCSHELSPQFTCILNNSLSKNMFPDGLKHAEIVPIHKKNDHLCKQNYRPVSILPSLSKIFERHLCEQLQTYFNDIFNPLVAAYRKKYSCHNVLLDFIDKWRVSLDRNEFVGSLFMDLSKCFDAMPHSLLICKLHAYGLSSDSCRTIASYLSDRKQRTRLGIHKSTWSNILKGFPQGSLLGPFLFNVFINDLFMFISMCILCNYADDNTLMASDKDPDIVMRNLRFDAENAINWFNNNMMKANPNKFQVIFVCPLRKADPFPKTVTISDIVIQRASSAKLLGVIFDDKLNFNKHVNMICSKAARQLNALIRIKRYISMDQRKRICESFILSNFNYCPLVWHFCSKTSMHKIEKIQERALRFLNNDF